MPQNVLGKLKYNRTGVLNKLTSMRSMIEIKLK